MFGKLKVVFFGALCGAFLFAAAAPSLAGPVSAGAPLKDIEATSPLQQIRAVHPATGRHCLKWTRTWNPRHGIARRRCVQWR
jgi:hypothetical protein